MSANAPQTDVTQPTRRQLSLKMALSVLVCCVLLAGMGYIRYRQSLPKALFTAASVGDVARIKNLLASGVDANTLRGEGIVPRESPLLVATREQHWEAARTLLQAGADPNVNNPYGESVLFYAVYYKDVPTVRALLDRAADVRITGPMDIPLLLTAVQGGDAAIVRLLLEKGADPKSHDNDRNCALSYAGSRADLVRLLVDHGADVNVTGQPITVSMSLVRLGLVRGLGQGMLIRKQEYTIPIPGYTPLMVAVSAGDYQLVKYLLAHGALPRLLAKDRDHGEAFLKTPLELAIQHNRDDITALLRQAGATK